MNRRMLVVAAVLASMAMLGAPAVDAQRGGGGGRGTGPGGGRGTAPGGGRGAPAPSPASGGAQRPDDTAVFRGGVTAVQVDVFVTDAAGTPVTDLTQDDFEVREAGGRRSIVSFASVSLPPESAEPLEAGAVEPDVRTNAAPPGRTYLIALDEVGPDRALRARVFLKDFINKHFGPNDVAAVALTGRGLSSSGQDFTSSKRLLFAAIDKFTGGFGAESAPDVPLRPGAPTSSGPRQLASSLRNLTEFLATMPGRKVLLYVGEGMGGIDAFDVTDYNGGALTPAAFDAHAAIAAATRGNVTIYPVDPRGLTTDLAAAPGDDPSVPLASIQERAPELTARAELSSVASVTGGFPVVSTNNFPAAFERLVRENSTYYTIGFSSEYRRRDGRFVPIDVRVSRPGLQVRARPGYVAPLGDERKRERIESEARLPTVAEAIASPVSTRGVRLRVFAAPYHNSGDKSSVALVVEVDPSTLGLPAKDGVVAGDFEVSYVATDEKGKVHPGRRHVLSLSFKADAMEQAARDGIRLLSDLELPAGRHQIRVAAGSPVAGGSVVYDLEVPDFRKTPLSMSGLALTSSAAAKIATFRPRDPIGSALPAPPAATRSFARTDTLFVFGELYDNKGGSTTGDVEVTTSLVDADGGVVFGTSEHREARSPSGARGFTATIPLENVAPGSYAVKVEGRSPRDPALTVSRSVPIQVR